MKKILVSCLVLALAGELASPLAAFAQSVYQPAALDGTTWLDGSINVPGGSKKTSKSYDNANVRDVLHQLAVEAGFNLVMDPSVTGTVAVELNNVTINEALQSVAAMSDLKLIKQNGGIYLAISRQAAETKGIAHQLSKVIKIYYSNAGRIANVLNSSILADPNGASGGGGATTNQKARPDSRTNSVLVVGTQREIELAEAAISKLDVPRQSKTFYLSHANALDVATMLSSSIFNDGTANLSLGAGGGGSSGGNSASPSPLRVEREDVQEGTGINNFGSGSGGSGGGAVSSGLSSDVTLRGYVKASDTLSVSPEGPMVIPDTRQNSVTVMGTAEQIAMAEKLIPTVDAQLPQVAIEASLVEITEDGVRDLSGQLGTSNGRVQTGFNNQALEGQGGLNFGGNGLIGLPTVTAGDDRARSGINFSTEPLTHHVDYVYQIRSLVSKNKAKILANPTVVAAHDTEAIISIVDQIVRRVTVTVSQNVITQNVEIGEAGIVMDILPKIGEDGTISMRLRPSVTSVKQELRDAQNNLVTLLSKRDLLSQNVRVQDGQTLVIGGLIQQNETGITDKMPVAGDLPIVGAMLRSSARDTHRSEIVMLITPHILNNTRPTPTNSTTVGAVEAGMIPGKSLAGGAQ